MGLTIIVAPFEFNDIINVSDIKVNDISTLIISNLIT